MLMPPTIGICKLHSLCVHSFILPTTHRTPLILAVLESQLAIVKVLIQHKANPKVEDHQGFTALDHASAQNMHE